MKKKNGYAALLIIFVLSMVSLFIGTSLVVTGYNESIMGRTGAAGNAALYVAGSGVEEAMYKLAHIPNYGVGSPATFTLAVGSGSTQVTVSTQSKTATIDSVATLGTSVQKIHATAMNTSTTPGFPYAIHAGSGGFELQNTTVITGKNGSEGDVYSNAFIKGAKSDHTGTGDCKNSSSAINGAATAVTNLDKLALNDSGVCITKTASASAALYCYVNGDIQSPSAPSGSCPLGGTWTNTSAPQPVPLPDMGIGTLKTYLTGRGTTFTGNCVADGSNGASDCTRGTKILGNIIITGDLSVPGDLQFSGPVWVKGFISFAQNSTIGLAPNVTQYSQIVVADKAINSASNVTFGSNGTAFLLFESMYDPTVTNPSIADLCTDPSISISSNSNSVLFYGPNGCVTITANSSFSGAVIGQKVHVSNNSTMTYDPALATAVFSASKNGGWQITSYASQ